ncbi:MAG TPA: glycosyltransferase [Candidatus Eisenbacteria bacterium]|jgi:glycosyltransferase involved in cell wall biosynthesis|nr:glycosyltransferase [Candidatus Eisenbacteria bacterium]
MRFVSVIVPAYENVGALRSCLEALSCQSYPPGSFEILVVDNAPRARLEGELARFYPGVVFCHEPKPGPSAARNHGVARARGELLAFLDSDCRPDPDWIANGAKNAERLGPRQVVAGEIVIVVKDAARPTLVELYDRVFYLKQKKYVECFKSASTANLFVFREAMAVAGGFDEAIRSGQDGEWSARAIARGLGLAYCPDVRVSHPARRTFGEFLRVARRHAYGMLKTWGGSGHPADTRSFSSKFADWRRAVFSDRSMGPRQKLGVALLDLLKMILVRMEILRLRLGGGLSGDGGFSER